MTEPLEEKHVEIEKGLVIPSWFLKVAGGGGALFTAWAIWVTNTLSAVSYKLDNVPEIRKAAHAHGEDIGILKIRVNDLERRILKIEDGG